MTELQRIRLALSDQPRLSPTASSDEAAIEASLKYLASDEARISLEADPYWPKWDSPWWHFSVLHEMGAAHRIPTTTVQWMVSALQRQYVPQFFSSEVPPGRDPIRDTFCHCALGNIFQVLSAAGADMDHALPWARSWFFRYQMPDGGLNCDEAAYKATPPASSIVGTIAPLEAVLFHTKRPFTTDEGNFLDAGARCLIDRKLMLGCSAPHNMEEKDDEAAWIKPCFPRFYFYDVLRGLFFILRWADKRRNVIPVGAISDVVSVLCEKFPDGLVRIERHSFEEVGSRVQVEPGRWGKSETASRFFMMDEVCTPGKASPYLTAQWNECKDTILKLIEQGLIA